MTTEDSFITLGKAVLEIEKQALEELQSQINDQFAQACQLIFDCPSRLIVTGVGKSGHIGRKIAATFASTGTPSFFVHSAEASHGDLGMITEDDVVLAISNSGETAEVVTIIPILKRLGTKLISMTGEPDSTLAKSADFHINISVSKEACPLGLAPTASTTATLAMGDAMAVALLEKRGFSQDDFARSHPGGSLGKRLLLRLEDMMHTGCGVPKVTESVTIKDALLEISSKGLGMTSIVDDKGHLLGLFTDGDLRRILDKRINIHETPIRDVMTKQCTTASPDMLAAEALKLMEEKSINGLIVTMENKPIGAMNMQDLLKAGVI
ncbi:KpsF/GutQ family sugar-phosphate isomerase [Algicola sagamiensis]|uniref:KpsF/GutQ family sugar-phosphate isomerase n=1 Tax=Algicola sagamiensis TaxID=163869 RepID=UPI000371481E|nr:KpsF/GutQ family sugar-phosphate isomerase [Algicola sagamiensis]